jgi:putative ABC transport system permease protein
MAQTDSGDGTNTTALIIESMSVLLTLMLIAVAGLGVLNSVVLDTRERVRDLGVCKAVGMSPRQTVVQVLTSVTGVGLVGGLLGTPAGYAAVHHLVIPLAMHAAGTDIPAQIESVYSAPEFALLVLGGVAIAVLGAMLPAGWAAKARTATALRTE